MTTSSAGAAAVAAAAAAGAKVNDIFEAVCRALSADARVDATSAAFSALDSNSDRVEFAEGLLRRYRLFPRLSENKKSELISAKFREEGNREFKEGNFHLAWLFYTKSIAFAPDNSEALGLAYANRSAVLLRTDFYEQCLRDIDRALLNNYPPHLRDKLDLRRAKCRKPPRAQTQFKYYDPAPTLRHPSQFVQCAVSALEIKESEEVGRRVVANQDVNVGAVLAVEEPYSTVLLRDCVYTHCANCLEICYDLIPCAGCIFGLFCSERCRDLAFKNYHQFECPIVTTLFNLELTKLNFLALRIAIQAKDCYSRIEKLKRTNKVYKSGNYEEIHFLEGNTHLRNSADLFPRSVTAAVIFNLLKTHSNLFSNSADKKRDETVVKELILRHMQTGPTNFHEISECREDCLDFESNVEIGAGAYAFLSLINHSCNPNVLRVSHGKKIVLRALRPIAKGEELFDNYGYHYAVNKKVDRQRELKKQYFFTCKCEACEQNWPKFDNLQTKTKSFELNEDTVVALLHGDRITAAKCLPVALVKAQAAEPLRPCKGLAAMQETIKRCYALLGNRWEKL